MGITIGFFVFILGTLVGSFLNVVALRYGTGMPIISGRSVCFSCGKKLKWHELLPIASFIFLKGRCGECKTKISWQYPIVEIITGLIFVFTFCKYFYLGVSIHSLSLVLYSVVVFCVLVVIAVYDFKHKIIPDGLVYAFIILSFLKFIAPVIQGLTLDGIFVTNLLAGPILALPFFLLWLISRGRWIGLGDAKLALGIGWFLGIAGGVSAVIIAFWIGAAFSVALILLQKTYKTKVIQNSTLLFLPRNLTIKSEIPFAPFLILGVLLVFLFGFDPLNLKIFL